MELSASQSKFRFRVNNQEGRYRRGRLPNSYLLVIYKVLSDERNFINRTRLNRLDRWNSSCFLSVD
jgi:hypothetical protein